MKVVLQAHPDYWKLTTEEKAKICNGCGAKGAWYNKLIPGKWLNEPCNIHDFDYYIGRTNEDKGLADRRFIQNNKRVVKATKNFIIRKWVKIKSKSFYALVRDFGDEAFWADKIVDEKNSEGKEVEI